jgi:hypothetical protein
MAHAAVGSWIGIARATKQSAVRLLEEIRAAGYAGGFARR